jgi:hypothetical protein
MTPKARLLDLDAVRVEESLINIGDPTTWSAVATSARHADLEV